MNSPINKLADGRYTVGQMIGTGGMADVYQGLDTRLNREVAIKVLRRDLADRKSTRLNSSHVSESRMPSSA